MLELILAAAFALAGGGALVTAARAPSPQRRALTRRIASAAAAGPLRALTAAEWLRAQGPITAYLAPSTPDAAAVAGSGGDAAAAAAGGNLAGDAGAVMLRLARLDDAYAASLAALGRARRHPLTRTEYRTQDGGWGPADPTGATWGAETRQVSDGFVRPPTRLLVLLATFNAMMSGRAPVVAADGSPIMDATTAAWAPAWAELLATYQPTDQDWSGVAERFREPAPSPGVLDVLGGLVGAGQAAFSGSAGGVLSALGSTFAPRGQRGGSSGLPGGLTAEEQDLLGWMRATRLEQRLNPLVTSVTGTSWREMTAAEALAGGEAPLEYAAPAVVELARAGAPLTDRTRQLNSHQLALKLTLLARRYPTGDVKMGGDAYRNEVRLK